MSWPADLFPSPSASDIFYTPRVVKKEPPCVPRVPQIRIEQMVRKRAPVTEELVATALPKIIIVGASIGGLLLAIIFEQQGIPYRIIERAKVCEPIESAVFFNAQTAKVFTQLGLNDEIVAAGRETNCLQIYNEDRVLTHFFDYSLFPQMYGSAGYVLPKPVLYNILLRHVPSAKIIRGSKILSVSSGDSFVTVLQDNGDTAVCDIVVGADGIYSAVRQSIFDHMRKDNVMDPKNKEPMKYSTVCLIGQTRALSDVEFPIMAKQDCQFIRVLGRNKPYSITYFTTKQRTLTWSITEYLDNNTHDENNPFRTSDWGQATVDVMCEKVKDIPIITGGHCRAAVGHLIELSDRTKIKKVVMEEKVFSKWYYNRTVLLGNGSGATNSVLDAVSLANWIVSLPEFSLLDDISYAFQSYQEERIPWVKASMKTTKFFKKMLAGNFKAKVIRTMSKYGAKPMIKKMRDNEDSLPEQPS
ncbi:hypothetical protein BGZ96_012586 [Linnemannia gamsii]|uniref:FAD-binding domain-containing protein n=1 Tax=Linnemannia gamsii TaxID=64522 RepID=A0ABQ7JQT7_9FUNG|nr:hypothetical protein BGZ96_012586 [Linnemannia gamsii]